MRIFAGARIFFAGRYENLYLSRDALPEVGPILDAVLAYGAALQGVQPQQFALGFWFNLMQPGDRTLPHCHDDDGELWSGAYYLCAPPASGALLLHSGAGSTVAVQPEAGLCVLFAPALLHEVAPHRGSGPRLSIGFNLGWRDANAL